MSFLVRAVKRLAFRFTIREYAKIHIHTYTVLACCSITLRCYLYLCCFYQIRIATATAAFLFVAKILV